MVKANPKEIEADFERRLNPGLIYCQRVGNIMGATTMLSLISTIDHGDFHFSQGVSDHLGDSSLTGRDEAGDCNSKSLAKACDVEKQTCLGKMKVTATEEI
jgi:hypothetical protein